MLFNLDIFYIYVWCLHLYLIRNTDRHPYARRKFMEKMMQESKSIVFHNSRETENNASYPELSRVIKSYPELFRVIPELSFIYIKDASYIVKTSSSLDVLDRLFCSLEYL